MSVPGAAATLSTAAVSSGCVRIAAATAPAAEPRFTRRDGVTQPRGHDLRYIGSDVDPVSAVSAKAAGGIMRARVGGISRFPGSSAAAGRVAKGLVTARASQRVASRISVSR